MIFIWVKVYCTVQKYADKSVYSQYKVINLVSLHLEWFLCTECKKVHGTNVILLVSYHPAAYSASTAEEMQCQAAIQKKKQKKNPKQNYTEPFNAVLEHHCVKEKIRPTVA